jgi:hypothetical protein
MKFEFKAVKKQIDLSEYAPEMAGGVIEVRVNVSRETLAAMWAVTKETPNEVFFTLLSELWGDSVPIDDIRALFKHCQEFDPQLWRWVTQRTFETVYEYQAGQKKG